MFDTKRFKAQMVLSGMNAAQVAEALGINESTFYRKIARDGDFTRSEINKMIAVMNIEHPEDIFFAKKLT